MSSAAPNFVDKVLSDKVSGSKLVTTVTSGGARPAQNGTLTGPLPGTINIPANAQINVAIGSSGALVTPLPQGTAVAPEKFAVDLQEAIRARSPSNTAFSGTTVRLLGNRLFVTAGAGAAGDIITFTNVGPGTLAGDLGLVAPAAINNVQEYRLGGPALGAQAAGTIGLDGARPNAAALIGSALSKTGIHALEDVDLFNILALPRTAMAKAGTPPLMDPVEAVSVIKFAETYCETRRAFFIIDTPIDHDDPAEIKPWLEAAAIRHKNAALYYPRINIPDPLDENRLRSIGASGTIAGLYARTDATRGVWKAPAGTEATLRNIAMLEDVLTDPENGTLNPLAINCLRNFPVFGPVSWGARTLDGADQLASEWKYVPVRRLALFLEESLFRGTKWVVFEPNDEPLWAQIRLNLGSFMHQLFRQGAFQGKTPREAYFVKCDRETTTQADINSGIVNIVVGFAPLKPAEFVVLKFQQMAGQIET